jgi:integrase
MAAIYPHKKGGRKVFQVRFNLYLPDGSRKTLYRYRPTRAEATAIWAKAELIENGSRASSLNLVEVTQAQHDGLLKAKDAVKLSAGLLPVPRATGVGKVIELHAGGRTGQWSAGQVLEFLQGADAEQQITQGMLVGLLQRLVGDPAAARPSSESLPLERRRLSTLIQRYAEAHREIWRFRTAQKAQENFSKVLELLGDVCTDGINQDMLDWLFYELARYPKWRNHPHLQPLTLEECRSHPAYRPISTTTFTAIWEALGGLLTYGSENGDYGISRNFCSNKIFTVKKKVMVRNQRSRSIRRLPYDARDIQRLIDQLGTVMKKQNPHKLWIPLIALYSGMRQGEICQLFCDDIMTVNGIPCFRIRTCLERKQGLKTEQSQRTIPIHSVLLKLGFLEFIESRRRLRYDRPWQNVRSSAVEYSAPLDTYGRLFEKWYNRTFRRGVILDEKLRKQKPFHSLRHTFINWFFQNVPSQGRDNAAVKGLVGHLETEEQKMVTAMLKGISWEVYSQNLNPERLLETLSLLDYGVDLSPLKLPVTW